MKDLFFLIWHRWKPFQPLPVSLLAGQSPRRLLVAQLQNLGDSLVTTPLVRALRRGFPSARIDVLVNKNSQAVYERNPDVNECLLLSSWQRGLVRWADFFRLLPELRRRKYDWILFDGSAVAFSYGLLAWTAGIPVRLGFDWRHRGILFTHTLPLPGPESTDSMVTINLGLCQALGIPAVEPSPIFPVITEERNRVMTRLQKEAGPQRRPMVVIHPGSNWPSNFWMPERFVEISQWLIHAYRAVVVFVGSPGELLPYQKLFAAHRSVLNWEGRTTLGELAALFEMADAVVTLGSGPSHLAAAVGATTLVLRSAEQPRDRWDYHQPHYESLYKHVPCSPCESVRCRNFFRPMWCMKLITVEDVKAALTRVLQKRAT